ncbi:unnamed protein product [Mytilus edulis]|uniref:Uncharacterized protein n=1 Tax=Mytilus edulis TaxID=6550 RepID=A0A8S3S3Q0_MYTED|nr:unnamed protein product [Mytilus edulis]
MSILFLFLLSCAISSAFLVETSTSQQNGISHGISGQNFDTLNQMVHNEHERSIQLHQYVSKIESRLNILENNCNCASGGLHTSTPLETTELVEKYNQFESKLITMTYHIKHIGQSVSNIDSKMISLAKNLSEVTNISSTIQIPSNQNSLEKMVSKLTMNSITLGQLQNRSLTNEQRLSNGMNEQVLIKSNLSLLDKFQKSMDARLQSMENIQMNDKNLFNTFYLNVTKQLDMLHSNEKSLNSQIQNSLSLMITDHQKYKNNLTFIFEKVSQNMAKLTNLESEQYSINASLNRNILYLHNQIRLILTKQTDFNSMLALLNQTVSHLSSSLETIRMQLHGAIGQTNAVGTDYGKIIDHFRGLFIHSTMFEVLQKHQCEAQIYIEVTSGESSQQTC